MSAPNSLETGPALIINGIKLSAIGIISQLAGDRPPGIHVSLNAAQGSSPQGGSVKGEVNEICLADQRRRHRRGH